MQDHIKQENQANRDAIKACVAEAIAAAFGKEPKEENQNMKDELKVKDEEIAQMVLEISFLKNEKKRQIRLAEESRQASFKSQECFLLEKNWK